MKISVDDTTDPKHPCIKVEAYSFERLTAVEAEQKIKELRAAIDRVRALSRKPRKFGDN